MATTETLLQQLQSIKIAGKDDAEQKSSLREIGIYIWVDRIANVDEVQQTFEAEFDLVLSWNTSRSELERYTKSPSDFQPGWLPDFKIKNGKFEKTVISSKVMSENGVNTDYYGGVQDFNYRSHPILVEYVCRIQGTFQEAFELENFPLDCQDLQINIELKDPMTKCIFHPLAPQRVSGGFVGDSAGCLLENSVIAGYKPDEHVFFEFYCTDYGGDMSNAFSIANLKFKLQRVFAPYFWRVGLVLMIASGCSVLAFAIDTGLADQLSLLFTLLLTVVAFQFVAQSYVPNLHYLTFLDYYVATTFLFVFAVIVLVAVINIFAIDNDEVLLYAGIISFAVFVIIHVVFLVRGWRARRYELAKLGMDRFDYHNNGYIDTNLPDVSCWGFYPGFNRSIPPGIVVDETHKSMLTSACYSFLLDEKSKKA